LDVPTVNIGVRQKGRLSAKSVINCNTEKSSIVSAINIALKRSYKSLDENIVNPYGQGDASQKVISMLKNMDFNSVKTFYDLKVVD